jgi:nucleoside-diphosphate-sugar epimerase
VSRRILVLGAGYIGAKVAERALAAGDEVVLADNWDTTREEQVVPLRDAGAQVVTVDIRREDDVQSLFAPRPDRVVFLAAQASRPRSWREPLYTEQTNLTGARHVAEAAAGTFVAFGSSLHVYGSELSGEVASDAPYGEQGDLAHLTKIHAELCLRLYARRDGFDLALLRLGIVHGPSPVVHEELTVVERFRRLVAAGEPLTVDDPGVTIGVVHVDDAARILLEAGPGAGNVVSDTVTVGQVAALARGEDLASAPPPAWTYASDFDYEHRLS